MLFLLLACAKAPQTASDGSLHDDAVRVVSPTNGETVQSPFVLDYEAGADIAAVHLETRWDVLVASSPASGEMVVTLEAGSWRLSLVGEDADGVAVSHHDLTVRVAEVDSSWVTITSPSDGAEIANPVHFM